ncbi:hypothetical protein CXB51_033722 [Gossypium anomalum]|uniref:RNase H type-1 domain-containing protein n=1 Tax=Gossypium anomalum TaxID=47600 RepID=A0A8J5Y0N4_9ROSI|nr:hypothetical protein CXB51_033722 [Gossypium anomalum]
MAAAGVVIRDENGEILGAYCKITYPILSVFAAKAVAVIHRLQFAKESGNKTVHAMAQEGLSRGEDAYLVEDAPALVEAAAIEDCHLHEPPLNCWFSSNNCEDLRFDDSISCLVALYPVLLIILFEQLSVGIPQLRDSF